MLGIDRSSRLVRVIPGVTPLFHKSVCFIIRQSGACVVYVTPNSSRFVKHILHTINSRYVNTALGSYCHPYKGIMSQHYPTQAELEAQPDRVAAQRLIASYRPHSADASSISETLCLHTDVWITWHELFAAASSRHADMKVLADLSEAILRTAATAGIREEAVGKFDEITWTDHHVDTLLMESREFYEGTSKVF